MNEHNEPINMLDPVAVYERVSRELVAREDRGEGPLSELKPLDLQLMRLAGRGILPIDLAMKLETKPTVARKVVKFPLVELEKLAKDPLVPVVKRRGDKSYKVYQWHIATLPREFQESVIHPDGKIRTEDEQKTYLACEGN